MPWFSRWFGPRVRPDPGAEQRQKDSWAELAAGRLPLAAQERLATQINEQVFSSEEGQTDYYADADAFGTAIIAANPLTRGAPAPR